MNRLVIATKNQGKVREIRDLLADRGTEIVSLAELDNDLEIVEDGDTFEQNAIKKARVTAERFACPALADDSGLEVDALNGRPGVYSARYGGAGLTDAMRSTRLLGELREVPPEQRTARFRCAMAFVEPQGQAHVFHGTLEGIIADRPAGSSGFGYDPIFVPRGFEQTLAQLGDSLKNEMSHRARALQSFLEWFDNSDNSDN